MSFDIKESIIRSKNGDEAAFEEIVERYTPMLSAVSTSLSLDLSEVFSECCMALLRAVNSFDLSQDEVTFGLYARICVKRRLLDYIEKMHRLAPSPEVDLDSIVGENVDVGEVLVKKEESEQLISLCRGLLSDFEYEIFTLILAEYKTADIARELGVDAKSVDNAKHRMFKKLRRALASK